jgi:hypothetical protein
MQDRLLELNKIKVKLWEVNKLEFTGINAVKFFKEILPELPIGISKKNFEGKSIYIYPFGEKGYQKWTLVKEYPYFFILHRKEKAQKENREGKLGVSHIYEVKFKLFISAHTIFSSYPKQLIIERELYDIVEAGAWREWAKEISALLKEELRNDKKKVLTFALKDGREITGVFEKKRSCVSFCYRLFDPEDRKKGISIYKHVIDDSWEG